MNAWFPGLSKLDWNGFSWASRPAWTACLRRFDKGTTAAVNTRAVRIVKRLMQDRPDSLEFGYIMYDPEMSFDEMKGQYAWIRDSGICRPQHLQNKMNIYWGTPQYARMIKKGYVDDTPLGDRWSYVFEHPGVGSFESAMRRFHSRYEREQNDLIFTAREKCREQLYKKSLDWPIESWLSDTLNSSNASRRAARKSAWYYMSDLIGFIEQNGTLTTDDEIEVWNALAPLFRQIDRESERVIDFTDQIASLRIVARDAIPTPGSAWVIQENAQQLAHVWPMGSDATGFVSAVGAKGWDRLDHSCQFVRFAADGRASPIRGADLPATSARPSFPQSAFAVAV